MSPVGFEPTIPPSVRPQTYVVDRSATGICKNVILIRSKYTVSVTKKTHAFNYLQVSNRLEKEALGKFVTGVEEQITEVVPL
jgi:hypothetical protein